MRRRKWNTFQRMRLTTQLLLLSLLLGSAFEVTTAAASQSSAQDLPTFSEQEAILFYQDRVRPILERNCYECHLNTPDELGGNFSIRSRKAITKGGDTGPAIDSSDPTESLLLKAINYDVYEMPPDGKLQANEIEIITTWVRLGLPGLTDTDDADAETAKSMSPVVDDHARAWWAFRPLQPMEPPQVTNKAWVRNEVDQFVLARLEAAGVDPAPPATRATLIRRVYYDLLGLPPTREQVQAFVDDPDPNAYARLVDTLLESPHYGEKWGRHWLDLVRYAESNSFERDGTKPFAWRYRDYVIRSFNQDKPYDQFLREQLAGDESPEPNADSLIATGYYRLGQWDDEPADPLQAKFDELDDILATTSQTMLGLTINCARCHDHKIDPIPSVDYYRMLAHFQNIRRYGIRAEETVRDASLIKFGDAQSQAQADAHQNRLQELESRIASLEALVKPDFIPVEHEEFQYDFQRIPLIQKRVGKILTEEQFQAYREWTGERKTLLENPVPGEQEILCVKESGSEIPTSTVLVRGNPHVHGPQVEPGFLSVLSAPAPPTVPPQHLKSTGLRTTFANWITSSENPLPPRVMVNRIWQFHFGRGIVRTSSDFGYQGSPPTHPELLDWLAQEFIDRGWKIKSMHRLLLLSNSYQMSSQSNAQLEGTDPENNLFWRFSPRRLSAEEIRDSVLFVSGELNLREMYGPSVYPQMPQEVLAGQSMPGNGWEQSPPDLQNRRSIYVHVKRSLKLPILANFDAADCDTSCPVRFVTTQPTQALGLLNSDFSLRQAEKLLALARRLAGDQEREVVGTILGRVMQRQPTEAEIERGLAFVDSESTAGGVDRNTALRNFCLLAINLNEFVYVD